MWKPEEIRNAEAISAAPGPIKGSTYRYIPAVAWDASHRLATAILKHRSDYSEDCEPLPVDEAFCRSLGMEVGGFAAWTRQNSFRALHVTVDLPRGMLTIYVLKPSQNELVNGMCLGVTTRPQLRSLLTSLAALGGGT
jgi:hypothetical protein